MSIKNYQMNVPQFYSYSDIKCAISKKEVKPHQGDHFVANVKKYVKRNSSAVKEVL